MQSDISDMGKAFMMVLRSLAMDGASINLAKELVEVGCGAATVPACYASLCALFQLLWVHLLLVQIARL